MRTQAQIVAEMRTRIGGRRKMMAILALSDKASDLADCDAALTAKLDRALATLD